MRAESRPPAARMLLGTLCGALVAIVAGYAACYVFSHFGLGVVSGESGGRAIFSRAALNLYAMQHITLVGGDNKDVFAAIAIPLSLWAVIPGLALVLGGYCSSALCGVGRRRAKMACAIWTAVFYAVVLAAASRLISARIDSFLVPELAGLEPNPYDFPFRPDTKTTVLYAGLFGLVFAYLGTLLTVKKNGIHELPGKRWACVKAVAASALLLQLLIVLVGGIFVARPKNAEPDAPRAGHMSFAELLPTAAGMGYAMVHGATLNAVIQTYVHPTKRTQRPFDARVNIYSGTLVDKVHKPMPHLVSVAAAVLGALAVLLMGRLAVCWGSRDGSLATAARVALFNTIYLALIVELCNSALITNDIVSVNAVVVSLGWGLWLLYSFLAVFALALIGASAEPGGRPHLEV